MFITFGLLSPRVHCSVASSPHTETGFRCFCEIPAFIDNWTIRAFFGGFGAFFAVFGEPFFAPETWDEPAGGGGGGECLVEAFGGFADTPKVAARQPDFTPTRAGHRFACLSGDAAVSAGADLPHDPHHTSGLPSQLRRNCGAGFLQTREWGMPVTGRTLASRRSRRSHHRGQASAPGSGQPPRAP